MLGRGLTGKIVDEIYGDEDRRTLSGALDWVSENKQPLRISGSAAFAGKDWLAFEAVYLPLGRPGSAIGTILIGSIFG
jgi:hypothetical protein